MKSTRVLIFRAEAECRRGQPRPVGVGHGAAWERLTERALSINRKRKILATL